MPAIPDSHRPLLDGPTAILATIGPDGRPQLSAVWFIVEDDGTVKVSLNSSRQKLKNLQRNPAVNFFILDPENDARYLELRGDAELEADPDHAFADRVGAKYGGANLKDHDGPDDTRFIITIVPAKVYAADMSG